MQCVIAAPAACMHPRALSGRACFQKTSCATRNLRGCCRGLQSTVTSSKMSGQMLVTNNLLLGNDDEVSLYRMCSPVTNNLLLGNPQGQAPFTNHQPNSIGKCRQITLTNIQSPPSTCSAPHEYPSNPKREGEGVRESILHRQGGGDGKSLLCALAAARTARTAHIEGRFLLIENTFLLTENTFYSTAHIEGRFLLPCPASQLQ